MEICYHERIEARILPKFNAEFLITDLKTLAGITGGAIGLVLLITIAIVIKCCKMRNKSPLVRSKFNIIGTQPEAILHLHVTILILKNDIYYNLYFKEHKISFWIRIPKHFPLKLKYHFQKLCALGGGCTLVTLTLNVIEMQINFCINASLPLSRESLE